MDQASMEKSPGKTRQSGSQLRILVVPLDWGLGHATRCIPVIRELLAQDCEVWLAGEGAQENLLKEIFPQLPFLQLEGYRVRYGRSALGLILNLFRQTRRILRAIRNENEWLKKIIAEKKPDAVISDNRFGLSHPAVPCIFITHQLYIKSSLGKWSERLLQQRNYGYINRFTACWVPDEAGENNLAGILSHPPKKPAIPVHYTGILSRFSTSSPVQEESRAGHILVILSGPEPQRSILENKIINEISHYQGTVTVARGLPGNRSMIPSGNMIRFYNHLPAGELYKEIRKAEFVIGRCGYSTVMDLVALQKRSILVPTPGQTEQEYLAGYLQRNHIAFCVPQKDFLLNNALASARQFDYRIPATGSGQELKKVVSGFIASLAGR